MVASSLQDFIVCCEMVPLSILHWYGFSWKDYDKSRLSSRIYFSYAIRDVLGVKDIFQDAYYIFNGTMFKSVRIHPSDGFTMYPHSYANISTNEENGSNISLEFDDIDVNCQNDTIENEYQISKQMIFGDMNFPVLQ